MMSPKEVMEQWLIAFNSRNARMAADLYHEDCHSVQIAFGTPLIGREAVYQDLLQFFVHNPDSVTNKVNLMSDGEWAAIEWSGGGTFFVTPDAEGKPYKLRGCGFFRIVDGKIKEQRGYFDKATWFKQVGLPLD